ncbi:prenylated Rab acceptor protein 1-like [Pomacea canaliculata]|uniref:prenylated Rab acceptor protein 1-like n=1 Tax=Pomacea canaliculata TaxID=400727 RepID=UPI000D73C47E|nr:prenylated Rab acceptor protein 1-like [Pomacea canaliculata]
MAEKGGLEGNLDFTPVAEPSLKNRLMAISLSNTSAREWFHKTRERVRPWSEFINTKRFKMPNSLSPLPTRIVKNIDTFQGNYLFVFLGLVIFCVLTSPMLLIAIAACLGACYIISIKNQNKPLSIMGRELSIAQQYAAVGALSFPLFWIAGAGSAVFWIIGASFFIIMMHAATFITQEEVEGFDIEMDSIQTV